MEPKTPKPIYQYLLTSMFLGVLALVVIPQLMNATQPLSRWYLYLIAAIILEHILLALRKKVPMYTHYYMYLTNLRIICQTLDTDGRIIAEKDYPRKQLTDFHVNEKAFPTFRRTSSPATLFYGALLSLLPLNFLSMVLGWIENAAWTYLLILAVYEVVTILIFLSYFIKEPGLDVNRTFSFSGQGDILTPPPSLS